MEIAANLNPITKRVDMGYLLKLMARTESDYDAEALSSIRRANKYLRHVGASWPEIFLRLMTKELSEEMAKGNVSADLNAEQVLEQTLKFLLESGKISQEIHDELVRTMRMMFQSRDTNFARRFNRRVRNIMGGARAKIVNKKQKSI